MISFPYVSVKTINPDGTPKYDRAIDSKIKRLLNKFMYKEGVAIDKGEGFRVVADSDMNIKVLCNGAWAHVGGDFCYEEAASRRLPIAPANAQYDRIDSVVIRNIIPSVRKADLFVVTGVPAPSPRMASLTRNTDTQEICLATIYVEKNAKSIGAGRITDTRLNPDLCGVFTNAFGNVDTSGFFTQMESKIHDLEKEINSVRDGSAFILRSQFKQLNLDLNHPINSLFPTFDPDYDPNVKLGGIWELIAEGCALRQAGGKHPIGSQYGEAEHTLTIAEMPKHTHEFDRAPKAAGQPALAGGVTGTFREFEKWATKETGGGKPHNNIGPSIYCNIWKRVG